MNNLSNFIQSSEVFKSVDKFHLVSFDSNRRAQRRKAAPSDLGSLCENMGEF